MMATFYLFLVCSAILAVVSWLKPHRHTAVSAALVWSTPLAALRGRKKRGGLDDRLVAAALFVLMVALYLLFA